MIHKLQFRLLLAFIAVIVIAIGTVSIFVYSNTGGEFAQFDQRALQTQTERNSYLLSRFYVMNSSWEGIQTVVEQLSAMDDQHIIVTDMDGLVVANSDGTLIGGQYNTTVPATPIHVLQMSTQMMRMQQVQIGWLYINPENKSLGLTTELARTINLFLLWGGLLAIGIALVITIFLARRISAPVRVLTNTARQLGQGDFSHRVPFGGKGEIGELATAFNLMADDLQSMEKLRRNMVADTAHELRTPLSNITGYLEAIRDGVLQPDAATINSLYEEAALLSRLVADLQDLALAEAGKLTLVKQTVAINDVVNHAATAEMAKSQARGIALTVTTPETSPLVEVDSHRILQVLHNLLDNAMAHTPAGGSISVVVSPKDERVEISVTDTGEGIPASELPYIFERFYRVDKSRTRATGGHGLGLTIARRLVEAHNGSLNVTSEPGRGSRFIILLPEV